MSQIIPVLIPAYKPDLRLVTLCGQLRGAGLEVVVIDDGSGPDCEAVFEAVRAIGCHVERHIVNLGKGRALKTGINAAANRFESLFGLVTADADGQHTCADILRIIEVMQENPAALVTGARAFTGNVPLKSRLGNAITRHVYRFATGIRCHDTQTGLRGIPAGALGDMLRLRGERYEYEMTMLLKLRELNMQLIEEPIDTIYIDDNKGSHFHPFRDAARIYSVILRFSISSLLSFVLDYSLYLLCLHALHLSPAISYVLVRPLSSLFNYWVNRNAVFGGRGGKRSILRYYLLAAAQMAVGAGLVQLLYAVVGMRASWIKLPVDALLFLVSYVMQREFVFSESWSKKRKA